jgi:type IV secretory pathway TraG/TraD family ATPase VirD4
MIKLIDLLFELVGELFKLIWETCTLLWSLFDTSYKPSQKHESKLISPSSILKKYGKGISIGGIYSMMKDSDIFRHVGIIANSGGGKSQSVCLPTIHDICGKGNPIVVDVSSEILPKVLPRYKEENYQEVIINPSNQATTDGWNPFPKEEDLQSFFTDLVQMELGTNSNEKYWQLSAINLLTVLARPLYKLPKKYQTLASVYDLLNYLTADQEKVDMYMSIYSDQANFNEYLTHKAGGENLRSSIISTAKSSMQIFGDDRVRKLTSNSTFEMKDIRKGKKIVFLQISPADLTKYRLIISLFFNELFNQVMREPVKEDEENLYCIVDEAGIFRINNLHIAISQIRKARMNVTWLLQHTQQLYNLYGKELGDVILGNTNAQLFIGSQPLEICQRLEKISGLTTYQTEEGKIIRPLLSQSDIRTLPSDRGVFVLGGNQLCVVPVKPFYQQSRFKKWLNHQPTQLQQRIPMDKIELLPLEELIAEHSKEKPTYETNT